MHIKMVMKIEHTSVPETRLAESCTNTGLLTQHGSPRHSLQMGHSPVAETCDCSRASRGTTQYFLTVGTATTTGVRKCERLCSLVELWSCLHDIS